LSNSDLKRNKAAKW